MARKGVEDAEAAIRRQQEDTETSEIAGLTTREPEKTCHEVMVAMGESLSNIANSDDRDNGEDEENEDTEQGKLSEDDKPG